MLKSVIMLCLVATVWAKDPMDPHSFLPFGTSSPLIGHRALRDASNLSRVVCWFVAVSFCRVMALRTCGL